MSQQNQDDQYYGDDDSQLSGSMTSPETFGNENLDEETQRSIEEEQKAIAEILPTAQKEIDHLNQEIANVNTLTDFVQALGSMPSDLPATQLAAKLDARIGYINYLINRKQSITDGLEQIGAGQAVKNEPPTPPALDKPIVRVVREVVKEEVRVVEPRPRGWKAIWTGIRDIFGGKPM